MAITARNRTLSLAISVAAIAIAVLAIWIPNDVASGITETARRRVAIGDALAPSVAAAVMLIGAALLFLERRRVETAPFSGESMRFLSAFLLLLAIGFGLMRWTGPMIASLAGEDYRVLRDTAPWKHLGFGLGGWTIVFGTIALAERRFSRRAALVGAGAVLALIAVYDLPFEDLLLPPNGDL